MRTDVTAIEVVRRFNRHYTQRVGALQESFHGTGLSLAAVRVLFEVGATGSSGVTVRDLRERLGLDSGYLSRILTRLTEKGLATVVTDRVDGAAAVDGETAIPLPADRPSTRRVLLRLVGGEWLVDEVRNRPGTSVALDRADRALPAR